MKVAILIPAYNEEKTIEKVLQNIKRVKVKGIKLITIVVDDGSSDKTINIATKKSDILISHLLNRGLGGALATGLEYAKQIKADFVITFDADGQHIASDIEKIITPLINNKADFVIGSRLLKNSKMPIDRKIINFGANCLTFLLWGLWITDSQSGLRGLNKKALNKIQIKMNRMEVSSEFIKEAKKHKLKIMEIPIKAIYTKYSKKKGQKNANSLYILVKLLLYRVTN